MTDFLLYLDTSREAVPAFLILAYAVLTLVEEF